jgi:hypothetical protein
MWYWVSEILYSDSEYEYRLVGGSECIVCRRAKENSLRIRAVTVLLNSETRSNFVTFTCF